MSDCQCQHTNVRVYCLERAGTYYDPLNDEWGDEFMVNEPVWLEEARCVKCDADVTVEYAEQIGIPIYRGETPA